MRRVPSETRQIRGDRSRRMRSACPNAELRASGKEINRFFLRYFVGVRYSSGVHIFGKIAARHSGVRCFGSRWQVWIRPDRERRRRQRDCSTNSDRVGFVRSDCKIRIGSSPPLAQKCFSSTRHPETLGKQGTPYTAPTYPPRLPLHTC